MERISKGEIVTLNNNQEYYVVEIIEQDNERYLYLVNEEQKEVVIAKEIISGNEINIETLDDVKKMQEISKIVFERLSN